MKAPRLSSRNDKRRHTRVRMNERTDGRACVRAMRCCTGRINALDCICMCVCVCVCTRMCRKRQRCVPRNDRGNFLETSPHHLPSDAANGLESAMCEHLFSLGSVVNKMSRCNGTLVREAVFTHFSRRMLEAHQTVPTASRRSRSLRDSRLQESKYDGRRDVNIGPLLHFYLTDESVIKCIRVFRLPHTKRGKTCRAAKSDAADQCAPLFFSFFFFLKAISLLAIASLLAAQQAFPRPICAEECFLESSVEVVRTSNVSCTARFDYRHKRLPRKLVNSC